MNAYLSQSTITLHFKTTTHEKEHSILNDQSIIDD